MNYANDCCHDEIEDQAKPGRTTRYRDIPDLPVPDDLVLPTCKACGEWFITRVSAPVIDNAMTPIWRAAAHARDQKLKEADRKALVDSLERQKCVLERKFQEMKAGLDETLNRLRATCSHRHDDGSSAWQTGFMGETFGQSPCTICGDWEDWETIRLSQISSPP